MHHWVKDLGMPLQKRRLMAPWPALGSRSVHSPLHSTAKAPFEALCHSLRSTSLSLENLCSPSWPTSRTQAELPRADCPRPHLHIISQEGRVPSLPEQHVAVLSPSQCFVMSLLNQLVLVYVHCLWSCPQSTTEKSGNHCVSILFAPSLGYLYTLMKSLLSLLQDKQS